MADRVRTRPPTAPETGVVDTRGPVTNRLRLDQVEPGGVLGEASPRLSWVLAGGGMPFEQVAYEVELSSSSGIETRIVHSGERVLVGWPFAPLTARHEAAVRVRSLDSHGRSTPWSESVPLVVGLLDESDWSAAFVSPATLGALDSGAPIIYTRFDVDEVPTHARLYAAAHGIYEPYLNGERIGDDVFAPGWTAYAKRLRYQSYDVSEHVVAGANVLSAIIGNGWYRGQLVWPGNRGSYGDRLALLAQLELTFADGSRRVIASDATWRACPSGVLFDDFYDGEKRDLRVVNEPDDARSEPVEVVPGDVARLVARRGPAVRITDRVPAVQISSTESGRVLVDFGQNLVGWAELVLVGTEPGQAVVVRHAEVLENGELSLRPLRDAKATCTYILGGGTERLRPSFTFSGFRYIDVQGVTAEQIDSVAAVVLGTDLERTGWLTTSDPRLNRLYENVVWSTRGNFLDVPTDCPQRDERLGWTGDLQVFAPTANYLFDTSGFLAGWLEDLAAEQHDDGSVPYVIPDVIREPSHPAATGWGDAATIVPMALYESFADVEMLRRQYPSMRAWVDKVASLAEDDGVWNATDQFGDWLDPTAPPDSPAEAKADPAVVATAFFARSAQAVADAAEVLGEHEDASAYRRLAERARAGFARRFVTADGRVFSDCQTVYALALCGELIADEAERAAASARLVELVVLAGYRVATGFLGTPLILDALVRAGRPDVAFRMLFETSAPSWLYAVTMGATTIWERWDALLPDGSVNPGSMTSFNHYAYGAVADWMQRTIGGIRAAAPGYRRFEVRPIMAEQLDFARARHVSPYGEIAVDWRREGHAVTVELSVPQGSVASVWVPGSPFAVDVAAGTHSFSGSIAQAGP